MLSAIGRRALSAAAGALTEGERVIGEKLTKALAPTSLLVKDVSGGCGAMYRVQIKSPMFEGKSLLQQHRMVNEVLKDDIKGMHGLQLTTSAP